ncbi:MAG: alpha-L-fucosidase [Verrucomicrobiota bacterium]|jgi:alpha-L-fucosidase
MAARFTIAKALVGTWVTILVLAEGQLPASNAATVPDPIDYATIQVITSNDSSSVIAEKTAKVLPRPNQTAWMRLERTFFLHFGVNTFNGVEWGSGREDPSIFNPYLLDANQWISAMKNAGGKMIVLVCKHHDGFCYWPTRYTSQSVASSPWLGGKGDEVRGVANAARAQGLKLGVYLSPADLYQLRTNPRNPSGYYGDRSSNVLSVIPTDPANFKTNPAVGRPPPAGFTNYTYEVDDYNRYFLNQLYELLTDYGPIAEVWFDGANPDRSVPETYDRRAWYDLIRHLQPEAVIAVKGPDVRWVGNENGVGRTTEWSVIPLASSPDTFTWPDQGQQDLGSRAKLTPGSYLWWYPAEVNEPILNGWFWAANKRPASVSHLIDIFYQSVGRNGNMLLNLSPDRRGLIPDNQLAALSGMAQVVNDTFAVNLAAGGKLTADTSNATNAPSLALDGNLDTWWEAAPGKTNATLTLTFPKDITFDVVSLQEAVDHRSQRIESFAIETWNGSAWTTNDVQTTVGHKRLLRLRSPVTTSQVRIRITGSRLEPTLAEVGLFKQAVTVPAPAIAERDSKGSVTISNTDGCPMVYTTDGTTPATNSTVYSSPIALPMGGTVQAASLTPRGRLGMVASKSFAGLAPIGWKVASVDSQETDQANGAAANAIDGNPSTIWQTRLNADLALPHYLTVDMGISHRIAGLTYLPRRDGSLDGVVETCRFETSLDGRNWITNVDAGRFGNIRNNPALQEVTFVPVSARFFRFTALQEINTNGWTSAAEISVLPAELDGGRK